MTSDYHAKYFAHELTKRRPSDSVANCIGANRNTLKVKIHGLVDCGLRNRHGPGKGLIYVRENTETKV